jgi:flagellar basal-body rod modification protein FlgD
MSSPIINNNPNYMTQNVTNNHSKDNFTNSKFIDPDQHSKAKQSTLGLANDFNQFVRLLLEQIKHQDPTEPMKTNEMTQQIVAFTGVEQSVATNRNLEKLIELNQGVQFNHASHLVGKLVTYDASTVNIDNISKTGSFIFDALPREDQTISNTNIKIIDQSDKIVRNIDTKSMQGRNEFYWDGLNDDKKNVANGKYRIQVSIYDQEGAVVKSDSPHITDEVQATEILHDKVQLITANTKTKIDTSQIVRIENKNKNIEEKKL